MSNLERNTQIQKAQVVQIWGWSVRRRTAIIIGRAATVTALLGLAGWLLQNFIQLRGVVNLLASRIDLGILGLCILLIVVILTAGGRHRVAWWIAEFVIVTGAAVAVDHFAPKPAILEPTTPVPLFAADVMQAMPNDPRMPLWLVSRPARTMFPVDALIEIRVVNRQAIKASLDSIKFEIKGSSGWITFKPIPTMGMQVFSGHLRLLRECSVSPPNVEDVFRSELEPGGRFEATVFLSSSVLPFQIPAPPHFRITLRDTVGREQAVETFGVTPGQEVGLSLIAIRTFGPLRNFSSYKQQRF